MIHRLVRITEYGLAGLFLYLGTAKLLGAGTRTLAGTLMASAELSVGVLILVRVSEVVSTPAVIAVAAAEVALFSRPPLAALACIGVHGATVWARRLTSAAMKRLYMIIEHFRNGDAVPVYRRFRAQGRLAPEGLTYVSSWVDEPLERCYQIMETHDRALIDQWIANWSDLVEFEVHPVMTSAEASEKIAPRL